MGQFGHSGESAVCYGPNGSARVRSAVIRLSQLSLTIVMFISKGNCGLKFFLILNGILKYVE